MAHLGTRTPPVALALFVSAVGAAGAAAGCGEPPRVEVASVRLHVAPGLPGSYVAGLAERAGISKPVLVASVEEAEVAWLRDPAAALALGERAGAGSAPDQPGLPEPFLDPKRRFVPVGAIASVLVLPAAASGGFEPRSLADLLDPRLRGRVALARPDTGGWPVVAAVLEHGHGERGLRGWFARLAATKPMIVESDAEAIALVAEGKAAVALSDTLSAGAAPARASLRFVFPDQGGAGCAAVPSALVVLRGGGAPARRFAAWLAGPAAEWAIADRALGLLPLRPEGAAANGFKPVVTLNVLTVPWDTLPDRRDVWKRRLAAWPRLPRGAD